MKSFKADYVVPVHADPIKNGIVTVEDDGRIVAVTDQDTHSQSGHPPPEVFSGILCPGFVNSHCHLELSHLEGKVPQHTGLVEFIKSILKVRGADSMAIIEAAQKAEHDMIENGIVAVGDISNNNITIPVKEQKKLYYHTFVEILGFLPHLAEDIFDKGMNLLQEFKPMPASITGHAPYSTSKELFRLIKKYCDSGVKNLLSIHNQESEDENKFFRYKLGKFNELYEYFGMDTSHFKPQARNSLQSMLPLLTGQQEILLVHNTCTNLKDIYFLKRFDKKINWCFCPNANLYIENHLPKINLFIDQGFNLTLGTDSLASNTKLCILHEMKTIQHKYPAVGTEKLIEWGTLNGAKFLGIADDKGSLEPGKKPGLNLISEVDGMQLTSESTVKKLV